MSRTCSTVTCTIGAEIKIDLLELVCYLPRVATGQKNEERECLLIKLEPSLTRGFLHEVARCFFPAGAIRIQLVDHLRFRVLGERLVKRAALIDLRSADKKSYFGSKISCEHRCEFFERFLHAGGTPERIVSEKIGVLQPDQFSRSEKRHGPQCLNRRPNARRRLVRVIRCGVYDLESEIARVRWSQLRREFCGDAFHFAFVRADNGVNVRRFRSVRLSSAWPLFSHWPRPMTRLPDLIRCRSAAD